jgi:microcystin-dependent protein
MSKARNIANVASRSSDIKAATAAFFAMNSAPDGWLKANGAAISRTAYAALFAVIGTTFGAGDGSTTFNIPDLRGYFPRGWDDSAGVDSGRAFGSIQQDELKSHAHTYDRAVYPNWTTTPGGAFQVVPYYTTATTNATGGTETRPKNVALLACIKY